MDRPVSTTNHNFPNRKSDPTDFLKTLKKSLKISSKNSNLLKRSSIQSESTKKPSNPSGPADRVSFAKTNDQSSSTSIEQYPIIDYLILRGSDRKNSIPDFDFIKLDKNLIESQVAEWSDNELFTAGRLMCLRKSLSMSVEFLKKSRALNKNVQSYKLWEMISTMTLSQVFRKQSNDSGLCCSARSDFGLKDMLKKIVVKLKNDENIEPNWLLMVVSLTKELEEGVDIEPSRYYAGRIKNISEYYGLLAWGVIYFAENHRLGMQLIIELIDRFPKRPEPYYLAWVGYFSVKDYEKCLETANEGLLMINTVEHEGFYIIFCLKLAKSYYYTGNFLAAIDMLYKKYLEHPNYPIFLYYFAKFCVLSEDFSYSGTAKGILRELVRLTDYSRKGLIYYWLAKAYLLTRQLPEVFKYALKTMKTLDHRKKKKFQEIREIYFEIQPLIYNISEVQQAIKSKKKLAEALVKSKDISIMHKPTSELLNAEIVYLMGEKTEAVNCLRSMISSSRLEIAAYFKLLEYDPGSSETIFQSLLSRVKSNQFPIQAWAKANLLYSKYLFKEQQYDKCFCVLRQFAKFIPPIPYLSTPYCSQLKGQKDLMHFNVDFVEEESTKKKTKSLLKNSSDKDPLNPSDLLKKLKNEIGAKEPSFGAFKNNSEETYLLTSKPKFLIYICKFSLNLQRNLEEALLAIKDYQQLLNLTQNSQKREKRKFKAQSLEKQLS